MTVHHAIIGLPKSGKTTFLAALYHLVDSGEVETDLVIDSYSADQKYLSSLIAKWLAYEIVVRTSQAGFSDTNVRLNLKNKAGDIIELTFPDLGGEEFDKQIEHRICRTEYIDICNKADGFLLFVTADRPATEGMTVVEQNDALGVPMPVEPAKAEKATTWNHTMIPTQAKVVELLQFLRRPPFELKRRKVALMISAWDLIKPEGVTPQKWLEREMPFLHNFLIANSDLFEAQIYGVSAQGCDMKNNAKKLELYKLPHSKRIICDGPQCGDHDITAPIRWLTEKT